MKQKIAIDIDDVIADSTNSLRLVVNERYGVNLSPEDYRIDADYRGYYERVWEEHGLHDVDFVGLNGEMVTDQSHVPLLPGAVFAMGELSKKYDIVAVTSRNPSWDRATLHWLNAHFDDTFTSVHFAGSVHHDKQKTKGELCREVGASVLIDDNPIHCRSALDCGLDAILFGDYGWHRGDMSNIVICKDWPAVLEYFDARSG